ncbi:hypothetical protein TURU_028291 [Turdus rufiventris]|nr:hypothetical protein TURU_028291 [Turdus rufiventris]
MRSSEGYAAREDALRSRNVGKGKIRSDSGSAGPWPYKAWCVSRAAFPPGHHDHCGAGKALPGSGNGAGVFQTTLMDAQLPQDKNEEVELAVLWFLDQSVRAQLQHSSQDLQYEHSRLRNAQNILLISTLDTKCCFSPVECVRPGEMAQHLSGFAVSASFVGPGICSWNLPEAGSLLQLDPLCSWIPLQLDPLCSWIPLQLSSLSKELPWLQESPLQCTDDNVVIMLR